MKRKSVEQLTRELKTARIAVGAAHTALAAVHKDQAEIAKHMSHFICCEPNARRLMTLSHSLQQTLSAEDQAEAKLQAALEAGVTIERQLKSAME